MNRYLRWALLNKWKFLLLPAFTLVLGWVIWQGFDKTFGLVAQGFDKIGWHAPSKTFPGIGKEFMPSLNEGSFLLMPTSMPHSSIEKICNILKRLINAYRLFPK